MLRQKWKHNRNISRNIRVCKTSAFLSLNLCMWKAKVNKGAKDLVCSAAINIRHTHQESFKQYFILSSPARLRHWKQPRFLRPPLFLTSWILIPCILDSLIFPCRRLPYRQLIRRRMSCRILPCRRLLPLLSVHCVRQVEKEKNQWDEEVEAWIIEIYCPGTDALRVIISEKEIICGSDWSSVTGKIGDYYEMQHRPPRDVISLKENFNRL